MSHNLGLKLIPFVPHDPRLVVVPDLKHQWRDQAVSLCKKVGLKPEIRAGKYGDRQNEVQKQSFEPGALVFANSKIEIDVCRGQPVGDPLYGYPEGEFNEFRRR